MLGTISLSIVKLHKISEIENAKPKVVWEKRFNSGSKKARLKFCFDCMESCCKLELISKVVARSLSGDNTPFRQGYLTCKEYEFWIHTIFILPWSKKKIVMWRVLLQVSHLNALPSPFSFSFRGAGSFSTTFNCFIFGLLVSFRPTCQARSPLRWSSHSASCSFL